MRFERFRSRILFVIGLGGAAAGCGTSSKPPPDAKAAVDAPKADAPPDSISIRRPFLIGASLRSSKQATRGDWATLVTAPASDATMDPATRDALAAAWLQDALEEHASIAAFSRFAMHLLSVGAPPDLIAGAQRAALDEIRHAKAAFGLARRYGHRELGPAPLRVDDALGHLSLAEIAELTAEEGCVGETLGALLAAEQARIATDPIAQRILRGIARDELRHAELAWRFVRWAVDAGGEAVLAGVARGVRRAAAGTLAAPRRVYAVDLDCWHVHGRTTCEEARAVAQAGIDQVIEPALHALEAARPLLHRAFVG